MNNTNFPYYPEPLFEPKESGRSEPENSAQKENIFSNFLKNAENLNTNSLISSLLSSGMLSSNNPLFTQALTKILNQEKTKKDGSSPPCTYEEL